MIFLYGKKPPNLKDIPNTKKSLNIINGVGYIEVIIEDNDIVRKNYLKKLGFFQVK